VALSAPELLTARHDVAQFSCGQPALDPWPRTREFAIQEKVSRSVASEAEHRPSKQRPEAGAESDWTSSGTVPRS